MLGGSRRSRLLTRAFFWPQFVGALVACLFANISATSTTVRVASACSALCGIGWVVWVELPTWSPDWRPPRKTHPVVGRWWLRIPFVFGVGVTVAYFTFGWTLPWLVNIAFGSDAKRQFVVTGWQAGMIGRGICSRPEVGHSMLADAPRAFCVPRELQSALGRGVTFEVEGRMTILGINTDHIYVFTSASGGGTRR